MNRSILETILGMIVIAAAIVFAVYAYNLSTASSLTHTKNMQASFNQSGGLTAGADVRMAGVTIGKVTSVKLDNKKFVALVDMAIQKNILLPLSTIVEIASDGFIGGKYVRLTLKNINSPINKTNEMKNTKDVETLEQLLGKFIFLVSDNGK